MVRVLSLLLPLALALEHILRAPGISKWYLCSCLLGGICICQMCPLSYEDPRPSLNFATAGVALLLLAGWFTSVMPRGCEILVCADFVPLFVYDRWRADKKFENVRSLFRLDSVWCSVEDYARTRYSLILAGTGLLLMGAHAAGWGEAWFFVVLALLLLIFGLSCARAYTGRTVFLRKDKESTIKDIIRRNLRGSPLNGEIDEHMTVVYTKATAYMDAKQPFLDEKFCIEELAAAIFSNRAYLSKAINYFSGRNFRQFVNYYRVNYSIELMKKDPQLKVMELAMMSGFHSVVTYNLAFKINTGTTPSSYMQKLIHQNGRERLSRKMEEER